MRVFDKISSILHKDIGYRKFIALSAIAPLCLIGVFAFIVFGKMFYMNVEYPTFKYTKDLTKQKRDAEIIIIGDSRGKAGFISTQNTKHTALNLSIGGMTPIVGYYTLQKYLKHNKPPKVIIMSYFAGHFSDLDIGNFWNRAVKFGFLESSELQEIIHNAKLTNQCKAYNSHGGSCDYFAYYKYHLDIRNFTAELINAKGFMRLKTNRKAMNELKNTNGHFYYGRKNAASGQFGESKYKGFKVNPLIELYLQKISNLAKEHNVKLAFYQMPYNESTKLNKDFEAQYQAFLESLPSKYNVILLNKPYRMPDSAFGDPSHLYKGSESVTNDINEKLEKLLH